MHVRHLRKALLAGSAAAALIVGVLAGVGPAEAATSQACDIYAAGGTPCVAAHSTTRALFGSYNGPLYQMQRASDTATSTSACSRPAAYANAAPQDSFCAGTSCTITKIYDQTSNHNDLPISWGGFWKGPGPNGSDVGADAMALPITIAGHPAYGVKVTPGVGYRIDNAKARADRLPAGGRLHGDVVQLRQRAGAASTTAAARTRTPTPATRP